jgi:hypothetical protein
LRQPAWRFDMLQRSEGNYEQAGNQRNRHRTPNADIEQFLPQVPRPSVLLIDCGQSFHNSTVWAPGLLVGSLPGRSRWIASNDLPSLRGAQMRPTAALP